MLENFVNFFFKMLLNVDRKLCSDGSKLKTVKSLHDNKIVNILNRHGSEIHFFFTNKYVCLIIFTDF